MSDDKVQVLFLQGESAYSVGLRFGLDLAKEFENLGFQPVIIDLTRPDVSQEFAKIKGKVKFAFSYNGQGATMRTRDQSFFELIGVPLFSWYVDNPAYNSPRIYNSNKVQVCLFNDQNHITYAKASVPHSNIKSFFPLAGLQRENGYVKPLSERTNDVIFMGTLPDINKLEEEMIEFDPVFKDIIPRIIKEAIYDSHNELLDIIVKNFQLANLDLHYYDHNLLFQIFKTLDLYIRCHRRVHVISSIKNHSVKVFGSGWKKCNSLGPNIEVFDDVEIDEALDIIADSKIVINILPNIKSGPNDRIYTAMLQGCVLLTDTNQYLERQLVDQDNAVIFSLAEPNLDDKISAILSNPDKAQSIATEGQVYAEANHTWAHRAKMLNKIVDSYRRLKK